VGDIGTHAHNLACFVTGLNVTSLAADLQSFGSGRVLDDNAHVMLRFENDARGMLWSSQVAPGNENALQLRVYGSKGGLEWRQEDPNYLWFTPHGEPKRLVTRGGSGVGVAASAVSRLPAGHPEGYLEGFATLYNETADAIRKVQSGITPEMAMGLLPGINEGMSGMSFINACVTSSKKNAVWVDL